MARLIPLTDTAAGRDIQLAFKEHIETYQARITNMKATLGHSLIAFKVYMQWYPLYQEVERIVGRRPAYLYAFAISTASNCPLCSTFFRKVIIDAGESPSNLTLTKNEQYLLDFGSSIARDAGNISDDAYNGIAGLYNTEEIVVLTAFAGQMIATNIFNNVLQTDIDNYLHEYISPNNLKPAHVPGSEK
jgi:hypothetical protein